MNNEVQLNPAELAAKFSQEKVFDAIRLGKSFRLEAGAGAGKTYSLVQSLKTLTKERGKELLRSNRQIACITYTNVAKDEIKSRTDNHPVIYSETIHAFCWHLIKDFQKILLKLIPDLGEKWFQRLDESGGVGSRRVVYELGFPKINDDEIHLHHDDVIKLMTLLLKDAKFKLILKNKFPIIFIDEYQDTNKNLALSIIENLIDTETGILIGFFGDHWQKIYGSNSIGLISSEKLVLIGKEANFRSERKIVEALNKMRPDLTQKIADPSSIGEIDIFHTNNWQGQRRSGGHWEGDLPSTIAHDYLEKVKQELIEKGWTFSPTSSKILMLTHSVLAEEQGYASFSDVFEYGESYLERKDDYISFLLDTVEPISYYFNEKRYGEMFSVLNMRTPKIIRHEDKVRWSADMAQLITIRETGTIGNVIEFLKVSKKPMLSPKVEEKEKKAAILSSKQLEDPNEEEQKFLELITKVKSIPYSQVIALSKFIDDKTPFSTKHGVKGAQFENVLIICGRGWNQYNWNNMLEWSSIGIPPGKQDSFERNRNLFYVACSRPKKRLAILFTQKLTGNAIITLKSWFGESNIKTLVSNNNNN